MDDIITPPSPTRRHPDRLHRELQGPEMLQPLLFTALQHLVEAGKLDLFTAHELESELTEQADTAAKHRDTNRRANFSFLRNAGSERSHQVLTKLMLDDLSYSGSVEDAVHFVFIMDQLAQMRFAEPSHHVYDKINRIAFDFGHVDQEGDWDAPNDLDEVLERATDQASLLDANIDGAHMIVRKHPRDHHKLAYSFRKSHHHLRDRHSMTVVRKRPTADIILSGKGRKTTKIEFFRQSSFVVSAPYDGDARLFEAIGRANPGEFLSPSHEVISEFISETLVSPNKRDQSYVLPCSVAYIAQIRNPEHHTLNSENRGDITHDS